MADKKPLTSSVLVSGFPPDTRPDELSKFFDDCGRVRSVLKSATDNFAFVEFEHQSGAKAAMRDFHGKTFKGAPVKVELSTQSDQSAPRQHSPEVDHHSSDDHQRRGSGSAAQSSVDRYKPSSTTSHSRSPHLGGVVCYNCNEPGHKSPACPHPPRDSRSADTRGTKIQGSALSSHRDRDQPYSSRGTAPRSDSYRAGADSYRPASDSYHPPADTYRPPAPAPVAAPPPRPVMSSPAVISKSDEELFSEFMAFKALKERLAPVPAPVPSQSQSQSRSYEHYDSQAQRGYERTPASSAPAQSRNDSRQYDSRSTSAYSGHSQADSYVPSQRSDAYVPAPRNGSYVTSQRSDSYVPSQRSDSYVPGQRSDSYVPGQRSDSSQRNDAYVPNQRNDSYVPAERDSHRPNTHYREEPTYRPGDDGYGDPHRSVIPARGGHAPRGRGRGGYQAGRVGSDHYQPGGNDDGPRKLRDLDDTSGRR